MDHERQLKKLQHRIITLEKELHTDELTQILNRRGLLTALNPIFDLVKFERDNPGKRRNVVVKTLSLVFADIDHFKKINDTFGHAAGDAALKKVAEILKESTRGIAAGGRGGGEEMILGLLGASEADAEKLTETIRAKIEATTIVFEFATMKVTASFGVAQLKKDKTLDELINRADKALYSAKETGRNKVVVAK